jgi:uroporphyrinogen decarboxylase
MPPTSKPLLRALGGEPVSPVPWWLMRQAGRYLPEYRELRGRARDFIELCLTPEWAAEITSQPVWRYRMDAAILFSDILLVPYALGQRLEYREGEGPLLDPIADAAGLARLDSSRVAAVLAPVFEAARRVSAALPRQTALIGFAGSPWTVAAYMVQGGGSREFRRVKSWAYCDPAGFALLIDLLVEATIEFLSGQIVGGVEAVQLFDSWAGLLPEAEFARWVTAPTKRIVATLKDRFPSVPIIGFPRGAGLLYESYVAGTGVDAVSLDSSVPMSWAAAQLAPRAVLQGNLDPLLLLLGGDPLKEAVSALRRVMRGRAYVFNLGHGVLPETPPENVAMLARLLAAAD